LLTGISTVYHQLTVAAEGGVVVAGRKHGAHLLEVLKLGRRQRGQRVGLRRLCDDTALFGTPDQIAGKLEALHAGGVEYVIVNFGGSRENIRRFARDIMPAFADPPRLVAAAK